MFLKYKAAYKLPYLPKRALKIESKAEICNS